MSPIVAAAPWYVNVVMLIVLAVIAAIGPALTARATRGIKADLKSVKDQTENEHQGGDFPNLRDELTEVRVLVGEIRKDIGGLREDVRHERMERLELAKRINREG